MASTHLEGHEHLHSPGREARIYTAVLGALVILTFITVGASYIQFGEWNAVVAIVIATIKASLVGLFFMHLRHDKPINAIIFLVSAGMLALFLLTGYTDVITARDQLLPSNYKQLPMSTPGTTGASGNAPQPAAHR